MKKIKLLLLLALLVAGASGAWAQQQKFYGVVYSPSDLDGVGFTITNSHYNNSIEIIGNYYYNSGSHAGERLIVLEGNGAYQANLSTGNISNYIKANDINDYNSSISVVSINSYDSPYIDWYNDYYIQNVVVIRYTPKFNTETYTVESNLEGGGIRSTGNWPHNEVATLSSDGKTLTVSNANNNAYAPVVLAAWNVNKYIVPKTVEGYKVAITVEGSTIKLYYYQTWTKDGLEYSNFHIQSTNNQGMMDSKFDFISGQPELAVRLHLDQTKIVTDTVKYAKPLWANPTVDEQRTLPDDDGDGVGIDNQDEPSTSATNAEYTYLGQLDATVFTTADGKQGIMSNDYFYLRRHAIAYSDRTSVTIPREVTFGNTTYKVTAIQKWGMDYAQTHVWRSDYCYNMNTGGEANPDKETKAWEHQNINDHRNEYLTSVTFEMSAESPSNIHSIGDYAFMSLFKWDSQTKTPSGLEEITIPNSTTYLGAGAFEMCQRLKDVTFQKVYDTTDPDYDKTRIKNILDYTFYSCPRLGEINLPIGIETIGNCAFQYNFQMTKIELPNGLTSVGDHFLCCASSLINVTIPHSVTRMAGACFHGCESLRNVYLMGPASALIKESGSGGTFDANPRFCKEHVQDCTFWVFDEYYSDYADDAVWSEIDEDGNIDGRDKNGHPCINGNWLKKVPNPTRTFEADKWVTAIFPNRVTDYKNVFKANGEKQTRVARMTSATVTEGEEKDPKTGRPLRMYNLTFELITGNDIPANEPLMICPASETTITLYTAAQAATDEFKDHMTDKHPVEVSCGEKGKVVMKGQYSPYDLKKWDFFFAYPKDPETGEEANTAKFYRVPANSNYIVDRCRCWWTIEVEGMTDNGQMNPPSAKGFSFFDDATGINNVETRIAIDAIYDLNGRKIDIDPASLPKGMYIKNGKKYIKN